jgi:DNA-binding NarL/FixJ family response regulator
MSKLKNSRPNEHIRVAVIEDHAIVRQSIVVALKKEPNIVVPLQAANGRELLEKLPGEVIDIVLLDLDMPVMNGKETLRVLQKDFPSIKVIMLSMHEDPWIVSELLNEGVSSYLKKGSSFDEMIDALFNVKYRGKHVTDIIEDSVFSEKEFEIKRRVNTIHLDLTSRQLLILKMICDGKKSEEIADRMMLSKKSIDAARAELMKRIGAKNPADLVRKSILLGLYKPRTDEQILNEDANQDTEREVRRRLKSKKNASNTNTPE